MYFFFLLCIVTEYKANFLSRVSVLSQNNRMMSNMVAPPHPAEDKLLAEVQVFTLVSHLFWTLWSIVQSQVSTIPFGYTVSRIHYRFDCMC